MPIERRCEKCGAALETFGAEALCPNCMLREAIRLGADLTAQPAAGGLGKGDTIVVTPITEKPGDRIGRYKLLEPIGEGGMGVVYMAEQEEPVRRRVALKVVKLGMDTKSVIARFEAERQALALMDHQNIAKVLDAGATETGRPYFVMELVRGIRITDYCDQNHCSTQQRLDLFTQICKAIQHAHQKGIIHRDIKPSNILVTLHDGVPVPKIIDFGIAKATNDQRLTDKTLFTAFQQFVGTPAYMSPEQAEMSGLDIDTRSDIYSLGVLLYELLTGRTPFDANELVQAGLDEMRRKIREDEPRKPSTRLSTMGLADVTDVTNRFKMSPTKLAALVRGDLDWIVMKCLEKDRTRRYDTANGLAMDLQRHVNSEPVVACPPSSLYRFQKMARRNKFAFAAASAVAAALLVGLGIAAWQFFEKSRAYNRAVEAEKQAKSEASKSQQVAEFLKDMLNGVGPSVALGRDVTMLREILDKTAERIGKDLTKQPAVEAELRSTIGNTYYELGDWLKAEAMHRQALRFREVLFGYTNELVAASLRDLGDALCRQAKRDEAEMVQRKALALREILLGDGHPDVADSLTSLAGVLMERGKQSEAELRQRKAVAIQKKLAAKDQLDVVDSLNQLTLILLERGKPTEAERTSCEALELCQGLPANGHPSWATSLLRLGYALYDQGKLAEAEIMCRKGVEMRKRVLGHDHPYVASAVDRLAGVLLDEDKLADAETLYHERLEILKKRMPDDCQTFQAQFKLGECLLKQKKYAEAEPFLLSGYRGMKEREDMISTIRKMDLKWAIQALAQLYEAWGKPEQAAQWKQKLVEFDKAGK